LIIIPQNFSFKNKNANQASRKGISPYFEKQKNVPITIKLKKNHLAKQNKKKPINLLPKTKISYL